MYSWNKAEDRVSIAQMNSELQHAQLELLSAHCATHQLRLRFSVEDLARYGERDVLRKSADTASALSEYFSSIQENIRKKEEAVSTPAPALSPGLSGDREREVEVIERVCSYLSQQRDHYVAAAVPLTEQHKILMRPYFSASLLDRVRVVELDGKRLPNLPFYREAKALGFEHLPEFTHMASLTLIDVLVFSEPLTERRLFHALVHAVQFQVLGLEHCTELFVGGFGNTQFTVPLDAHAYSLESRFARPTPERFSVEDEVRLWLKQGRY
jgi:hypothetical protein